MHTGVFGDNRSDDVYEISQEITACYGTVNR